VKTKPVPVAGLYGPMLRLRQRPDVLPNGSSRTARSVCVVCVGGSAGAYICCDAFVVRSHEPSERIVCRQYILNLPVRSAKVKTPQKPPPYTRYNRVFQFGPCVLSSENGDFCSHQLVQKFNFVHMSTIFREIFVKRSRIF